METVFLPKRGVTFPLGKHRAATQPASGAILMSDVMKMLAPSVVNTIMTTMTASSLPAVPDSGWGWGGIFGYKKWGMSGNGPGGPGSNLPQGSAALSQGCGDCWWAMLKHKIMLGAKTAGRTVPSFSDLTLVKTYSAYSATLNNGKGYNLQTGANDTGTDPLGAYTWLETNPLKDDAGNTYPLGTPVSLTPGNVQQHVVATYLFLGVGVGVELQTANADQFDEGQPLSYVKGSPVEGGHELLTVGPEAMVEWGERISYEPSFIEKSNDQSEATFSVEMFNAKTGKDATKASETDVEAYVSAFSKSLAA